MLKRFTSKMFLKKKKRDMHFSGNRNGIGIFQEIKVGLPVFACLIQFPISGRNNDCAPARQMTRTFFPVVILPLLSIETLAN